MKNLTDKLRERLKRFLGLHPACTLPGDAFYAEIAHRLLYTHRVFGDRARVQLGRGVVLNDALINTSSGRVTLGDFAFCGHDVSLLTGTHDYAQRGFERQTGIPQEGRDIVVGEGVWLGSHVRVLGPCMIGAHAVVAAGSVVVDDLPPNAIYAGVPARKVRDLGPVAS